MILDIWWYIIIIFIKKNKDYFYWVYALRERSLCYHTILHLILKPFNTLNVLTANKATSKNIHRGRVEFKSDVAQRVEC